MNIDTNLILIKGEDKTASVTSWRFDHYTPVVFITFNGQKEYPYNKAQVLFLKPDETVLVEDKLVLNGDKPLRDVYAVQYFHHYLTEYCRLYYGSGRVELVSYPNIRIVNSALHHPVAKNCFEYLKQIAFEVGLVEEGHNILAHYYEKVGMLREDSVLALFLRGQYESKSDGKPPAIYPFGFNLSQKKAVENALTDTISIIEGPPGTGKTQTILNIIANAVMRGESVAVVSSNNSATANVLEKLEKYGVDFIAASLGSSANREAFVASQKTDLPDMTSWESVPGMMQRLRQMEIELDEKLEIQNKVSALSETLNAVRTEYEHFKDYYETLTINFDVPTFPRRISSQKILSYIAEHEQLVENVADMSFWRKLMWRIKYGVRKSRVIVAPSAEYFTACQSVYYERRLAEIEGELERLQKELRNVDFDAKRKQYAEGSMVAFKARLSQKYGACSARAFYSPEDLRRKSEKFIQDYPVVLSTTYSLRASLANNFVYDYVIVDEASQVDVATGALALSCAKKTVIVGDMKQLPNVVNEEQKQKTDRVFEKYGLSEPYRYSNHSLLSSVLSLFPNVPHVLLKEHYRCHPEIIGFCNQRFYNNELIVLTSPKNDRQPLMVYRTAPGNHARNRVNQRQIDVITREVFPEQGLNANDGSVGIVTPYRNQADELQRVFAGTMVKADTADKFQGQERSVMIFSTVDNEIGDFASDPNRLNVAVSRAVDQFIVVTDGNDNDKTSPIHELIGYIQYHNHEVINSEVHSVFDYLYHSYADAREEAVRKYGRVSEVDSENLMYAVIRDVLSKSDYSKYDVVMHVPLRMILSDLTKLNTRELSFATNHLTHVDFLIFSRLTHQPILVVEVDGFSYHNNEKQRERDQVKNAILEKYNVPILRLSTVGSGEKQKLVSALESMNVT